MRIAASGAGGDEVGSGHGNPKRTRNGWASASLLPYFSAPLPSQPQTLVLGWDAEPASPREAGRAGGPGSQRRRPLLAGWPSASGSSPTCCSLCRFHTTEAWLSSSPAPSRSSRCSPSPLSPACLSASSASAPPSSPLTMAQPFGSRWPLVRTEGTRLRWLGAGTGFIPVRFPVWIVSSHKLSDLSRSIVRRRWHCYIYFADEGDRVRKGSFSILPH